jgi:hypothetical protein
MYMGWMGTQMTSVLLVLMMLLSPPDLHLAYVLEGEAGNCSRETMLAVAYVYAENPKMYGYKTPSVDALEVASTWRERENPVPGARFVFSADDLTLQSVQNITKTVRLLHTECGLYFYGSE